MVNPVNAPVAEQETTERSANDSTVSEDSTALIQTSNPEATGSTQGLNESVASDSGSAEVGKTEAQDEQVVNSTEQSKLSESSTPDNANEDQMQQEEKAGNSNGVEKQEVKKPSVDISGSGKVQQQDSSNTPSPSTGSVELEDKIVEADQKTDSSPSKTQ